jgi:peptidoglycan-associated lipoprotein
MMKRFQAVGLGLILAAAIAGCGSTVKLDETPVESRTPTPTAAAAAQGAASGATGSATRAQSEVATVDLNRSGAGVSAARSADELPRVIYFDFDSFVIKDQYRGVIDGWAKALAADRSRHMTIEGHTDERGGSEYNLALGQKRAEAVMKSLELLGVADKQLEAVSYGKERPVDDGHDEAAWAKNRRAELKDR